MRKTKVVAVSGVSGAGKTTIVEQLAKEFSCPHLLFDDFVTQNSYPQNMKAWLANGANVSLIKTPEFANAIKALVAENRCTYLFIEEPFGRERDVISPLIDYVILLDQPLELCLARIIHRHTDKPGTNSINSISAYLDKYCDHFRDIYLTCANQVRRNADLVIKEVLSVQDTTSCIGNWLKNQTR